MIVADLACLEGREAVDRGLALRRRPVGKFDQGSAKRIALAGDGWIAELQRSDEAQRKKSTGKTVHEMPPRWIELQLLPIATMLASPIRCDLAYPKVCIPMGQEEFSSLICG